MKKEEITSNTNTKDKSSETEKKEPVSYSTNDRETAKKGNSGVFAYINDSGRKSAPEYYVSYWIIDFDQGFVYSFTDGNGDETCDRTKIDYGDLNEYVKTTWHDGSDVWSYGLHFKYKNQPSILIVEDNDHFEYELSTTNLNNALKIRDSKKIIDY